MIKPEKGYLLFIEPKKLRSDEPCDDTLTTGMKMLLARAQKINATRGFHVCVCGEHSDNCQHLLPDGTVTNSLAVHYLRWHNSEVPPEEQAKLREVMRKCDIHDQELSARLKSFHIFTRWYNDSGPFKVQTDDEPVKFTDVNEVADRIAKARQAAKDRLSLGQANGATGYKVIFRTITDIEMPPE